MLGWIDLRECLDRVPGVKKVNASQLVGEHVNVREEDIFSYVVCC